MTILGLHGPRIFCDDENVLYMHWYNIHWLHVTIEPLKCG